MPCGETQLHWNLKRLALIWAQQQGYSVCGAEVRLPRSAFRADLAAYRPSTKDAPAVSAIFECKQSRADFLKDSHAAEPTLRRLRELEHRKQKLDEMLGTHYPSLRKGESLFQEFDAVDPSRLEHKTYAVVMREIGILKNRLYAKTKFDKLTRYNLANVCYVVVEPGVLADHEAPEGWGLLVRDGDDLVLQAKPLWKTAEADQQLAILTQIAKSGTRLWNKAFGVTGETQQSAEVEETR
jgi:hypothetical protein